jgi:hypothetical protein
VITHYESVDYPLAVSYTDVISRVPCCQHFLLVPDDDAGPEHIDPADTGASEPVVPNSPVQQDGSIDGATVPIVSAANDIIILLGCLRTRGLVLSASAPGDGGTKPNARSAARPSN